MEGLLSQVRVQRGEGQQFPAHFYRPLKIGLESRRSVQEQPPEVLHSDLTLRRQLLHEIIEVVSKSRLFASKGDVGSGCNLV